MASGEAAVQMWMQMWKRAPVVSSLRIVFLSMGLAGVAATTARGEPLDLRDPRPRAITVRFENSPADAPDRLADTFTAEIPARFEPDPATGYVRARITGYDVEHGYFQDQPLRPGSFSDYVWTFDPQSGDVVSASLSGTFVRRFDLGVVVKEVDTHFEATLSTMREAGFESARRLFGQLMFPLCEQPARDCRMVRAARYNPRTGYVNAVGFLGASALGVSVRTFASIGEAIFSEQAAPRAAGLADAR